MSRFYGYKRDIFFQIIIFRINPRFFYLILSTIETYLSVYLYAQLLDYLIKMIFLQRYMFYIQFNIPKLLIYR